MSQDFQLPAAFKNQKMASVFRGRVGQDSLADGIASSFPIISYKGKIWAVRHRGDRKIVTRPDDGTPSPNLDVIILKQSEGLSKSYYKAYDAQTSEGERPICASMNGIVPDADVVERQSETCAICPRNVWRTDTNGRKGRECSDYKRLAVMIAPEQTERLFGAPLVEPAFLRVPPDSLAALSAMGTAMDRQGYHYETYWTRITFDPNKAHPSMIFKPAPVAPLDDEQGASVLELQQDPVVGRIIGTDTSGNQMRTVQVTASVTRPQVTQQAAAPVPEALVESIMPKPVARRGRPSKQEAPTPEQAVPHQSNGQPLADSGVEVVDDELDAEIARLIQR